ncbi:unnamed protein product [Effrenium voratum]|nr:unnamed protein product [Effrenium voratum]
MPGPDGHNVAAFDLEVAGHLAKCWGCGSGLPPHAGRIRCDFCGAWNAAEAKSPPRLIVAFYDLLSHPTGRRIWSSVMILGVMVTIHAIVAAGILYIYPEFLPEPGEPTYILHWFACGWLWANTVANFAEAACCDPGFVQTTGQVGPGTLEGYTFCQGCRQGKPPGSHHCRICRRCVYGMDHHCPFIGNCVGRSNRRPFVLFLFWASLSLGYVLSITCMYCYERSTDIVMNVGRATRQMPPISLNVLPLYGLRVLNHTFVGIHMHAAGFLLLLGSVTFFMTSSLLLQQVRLICRGQTTISQLQGNARDRASQGWKANCEEVFGIGPWAWFLPRMLRARANTKTV